MTATPTAASAGSPCLVAVLLKRVDLWPAVDPLTGAASPDPHGGLSPADRCALELALRHAAALSTSVLAVSAGPAAAEEVLREALAAGAARAVRVDLPAGTPSADAAVALTHALAGCAFVWCGDHSLDGGSGSVPAFVAGGLAAEQALGLTAVDLADPAALRVQRRLDGGRRELLRVRAPAVLSVEAGLASPRRPALAAVLAAGRAPIQVLAAPLRPPVVAGRLAAFRPRARALPGPDPALSPRERLLALSGALVAREPPRVVHAEPGAAAEEVLAFLRARGQLG